MSKWPFSILAIVLLLTGGTVIFLPLGLLFGYPWLAMTGLYLAFERIRGRLPDAAQVFTTWLCWLGIVVCLHGIMLSTDIALGGEPLSVAECNSGNAWRKSAARLRSSRRCCRA